MCGKTRSCGSHDPTACISGRALAAGGAGGRALARLLPRPAALSRAGEPLRERRRLGALPPGHVVGRCVPRTARCASRPRRHRLHRRAWLCGRGAQRADRLPAGSLHPHAAAAGAAAGARGRGAPPARGPARRGHGGPVNRSPVGRGLATEPLLLTHNLAGVLIAETYLIMPYAVLVLVPAFDRIDPGLTAAARGLGAGAWTAFRRVTFPLSLP